MTPRELRKILRQLGCEEVRTKGSHLTVRCGKCQTAIPIHPGDIPTGTLRAIERQLEVCLGKNWMRKGKR